MIRADDGLLSCVQVFAAVAFTARPTPAIAMAPTTAPVMASITPASTGLNSLMLPRLEKAAAQGAGDQSDEAVPYPAKAMLMQRRCSEMGPSEAGNDLYDQPCCPIH
jgi:hypothetical protein